MQKSGKKFLLLVLALVMALVVFAGCGSQYTFKPLKGYEPGNEAVESNGGFVAKKGNWIYFINGVESNTSSNTYGKVEKGALVRISASALAEGKFDGAETVIPEIVYDGNHKSGIFIYGDYVYYATPNNTKNMQAQIENSWLNFKRARLDGSDVLKGNYAQLEIGKHEYRYIVENDTVYLLYADTANSELHAVNTQTMKNTTLVKGYASYAFDAEDIDSPTVYYTMPVAKKNTYSGGSATNESYQQLFKVNAATTEAPRDYDLSDGFVDVSLSEGDDKYEMEYVNLGTLVLDGIGADKTEATTFNPDWTQENKPKSQTGFTYAIERYSNQNLYFTITVLSGDTTNTIAYVCRLDDAAYAAVTDWDTIQANPTIKADAGVESAGNAITLVSHDTGKATETALYYVENGTQYYIYLDSTTNNIYRRATSVTASGFVEEDVRLANAQTGAAFLTLDTESKFLYYSRTGTNGNALWRIRYDGTAEDYSDLGLGDIDENDAEEFKATQYLGIDYNNSWFAPEVVAGKVFFANAETYAENYVYVMDVCATNAELKERNEKYTAVQDLFKNVAEKFSEASNVMKYYYYGKDVSVVTDENGKYREEYEEEDIKLIEAFVNGTNLSGFDFASVKDSNTQKYYYNCVSKATSADEKKINDSLLTALVVGAKVETDASAGWTWQWAAIFVPIGVVVIGGAVTFLILRRRRIR